MAEAFGAQTLNLQAPSPGPSPHTAPRCPYPPCPGCRHSAEAGVPGWRNSHITGSPSRQRGIPQTGKSQTPKAQGDAQGSDTSGEIQPWARGRCMRPRCEILGTKGRVTSQQPAEADLGSGKVTGEVRGWRPGDRRNSEAEIEGRKPDQEAPRSHERRTASAFLGMAGESSLWESQLGFLLMTKKVSFLSKPGNTPFISKLKSNSQAHSQVKSAGRERTQ